MKGGECRNLMATLVEVKNFFGIETKQFRAEWTELSKADQDEIKTLVYAELNG